MLPRSGPGWVKHPDVPVHSPLTEPRQPPAGDRWLKLVKSEACEYSQACPFSRGGFLTVSMMTSLVSIWSPQACPSRRACGLWRDSFSARQNRKADEEAVSSRSHQWD